MVDVYAVYINPDREKEEPETEDYLCFWNQEQAEELADKIGVEVNIWTLLYSFEIAECNFFDSPKKPVYACSAS